MSKQEANNDIVRMRHTVRRVKVQTIHKLTKEIKLIRKKYENTKIEKHKRKADKYGEDILNIKKFKDDQISKFALTLKVPAKELLNNTKTPARDRALARLSSHKLMVSCVENFHTKYPGLADEIIKLRDKRYKREMNNKIAKEKRKAKKENQNSSDITDVNNDTVGTSACSISSVSNHEDESEEDDNEIKMNMDELDKVSETVKEENTESCSKLDKIKVNDQVSKTIKKVKKAVDKINVNKTSVEKETIKSVDLLMESCSKLDKSQGNKVNDEVPKTVKNEKKPADKIKVNKTSVEKETNKSIDSLMESCSKLDKSQGDKVNDKISKTVKNEKKLVDKIKVNKIPIKEETTKTVIKSVDSFFLSKDGDEEFLSIAPMKTEDELPKIVHQNFSDGLNRRQRRQKEFNNSFTSRDVKFNKRNTFDKLKSKNDFNMKSYPVKSENVEEKLHPSWEAKKQLKPVIAAFQGKKIVFDDN